MDQKLVEKVRESVERIIPETTDLRRLLHSEPELGAETPQTAEIVRSRLSEESIPIRAPLLGSDFQAIQLHGLLP